MAEDGSVVAIAATSASYNMVLQLAFRGVTFLLNAFILRYISPEILGVVNVRLMLLYTTTLFLAREAFRKSCLSKRKDQPWYQIINLIWTTVPIGVVCGFLLILAWIFIFEQPNPHTVPYYNLAVISFAVSTILELLCEPLYVSAQILLFVKLKVIIEGSCLALKCLIIVTCVRMFPASSLLIFSFAQIVYTLCYSLLYYIYFIRAIKVNGGNVPFKSVRDFFPKHHEEEPYVNSQTVSLTWSFFKQGILKQLLTEGERYVMTIFDLLNFSEQGIYDAVNNLGSLAARLIFLPVEESAYLLFSKTLTRGKQAKDSSQDAIDLASQVLQNLLRCVTLIGLTFMVFGYSYSYLLLDMYGGRTLSRAPGPLLLKTYSFYVLLIAINGVSEGFVFSVMSQREVDKYNKKMLLFSFVFLSASWFLTKLYGSIGFLLANCLNMAVRIMHSIRFIKGYYEGTSYTPLDGLKVSLPVLAAYLVSFCIMATSERLLVAKEVVWLNRICHVFVGGMCLLVNLAILFFNEVHLISFMLHHFGQHDSSDKHKSKTS